jgi:hypothetical protein
MRNIRSKSWKEEALPRLEVKDLMVESSISRDLIENAMDAIEQAVHYIFSGQPATPLHSSTDLLSLSPNEEEMIRRDEEAIHRSRPTMSALSCSLTSAISLLAIAHSLVDAPAALSPYEREQLWKKLASDTKTAGGAAARAPRHN